MQPIKVGHKLEGAVKFKDADGFEAKVDGAPKWNSSDESVASVETGDGITAVITGKKPGVATISMIADADLGEGVKELVAQAEVQVMSGEAVFAELSFKEIE